MDWKTASKTQAAVLEQALNVCRHALALGQLAQVQQAGVTPDHLQRLRDGQGQRRKN